MLPSQYRKNAEECRRLALSSKNPDYKIMLENMAQSWEDLALWRERNAHTRARIAEIDPTIALAPPPYT